MLGVVVHHIENVYSVCNHRLQGAPHTQVYSSASRLSHLPGGHVSRQRRPQPIHLNPRPVSGHHRPTRPQQTGGDVSDHIAPISMGKPFTLTGCPRLPSSSWRSAPPSCWALLKGKGNHFRGKWLYRVNRNGKKGRCSAKHHGKCSLTAA